DRGAAGQGRRPDLARRDHRRTALRGAPPGDRLADGDVTHLADAAVHAEQPSAYGKFGMCGRLDVYRQR
ncbi:hypothetical protein ABT049_34565, partial [Streptomyces sp. NPDC002553]